MFQRAHLPRKVVSIYEIFICRRRQEQEGEGHHSSRSYSNNRLFNGSDRYENILEHSIQNEGSFTFYKISAYLQNSYTKIQASRFDPRMIEQMKVEIGGQTAMLNTIAQVTAKTQISFLVTPFDPAV